MLGRRCRRAGQRASTSLTQVSIGGTVWHGFACGLKSHGKVVCWGDNTNGGTNAPAGTYTQISAPCAVTIHNKIRCWAGTPGPPSGAFIEVSASSYNGYACGLKKSGQIACWNRTGLKPPSGTFVQVSVSRFSDDPSACAVKTSGKVVCWGNSGLTPTPTATFKEVSPTGGQACGLTIARSILCWGADATKGPPGTYTQVSAGRSLNGYTFSCALATSGSVTCWGTGLLGETEGPTAQYAQVSVGDDDGDPNLDFACGLARSGMVDCWGAGAGIPAGTYTQINSGARAVCGLRKDGAIVCGGEALHDQTVTYAGPYARIGTGDTLCAITHGGKIVCPGGGPRFPAGSYTQVSVESGTACALKKYGSIVCLGGGGPSGTFIQVSAGAGYACGVRRAGSIVCWGDHPKPVPKGGFVRVSAGGGRQGPSFACGLTRAGTIECWGANPQPVPTTRFQDVSTGGDSACGLTATGGVWCWGGLAFALPGLP